MLAIMYLQTCTHKISQAGGLAYASTFRVEESKFVDVHILYCRIIVGAPMGTFPGGLPLTDPGQSAENQTGLVYSCPVQPGVCEGVRGDTNITAQDIDTNMAIIPMSQRDLPTNGPVIEGRLFDQARKNICMFMPKFELSTNITRFS